LLGGLVDLERDKEKVKEIYWNKSGKENKGEKERDNIRECQHS
jgi:hypothetical protein